MESDLSDRRLSVCGAGGRESPARSALEWLMRAGLGEAVSESPSGPPCPALTGACVETAVAYGRHAEAARWARWLFSTQGLDGAWGPTACCGPAFVSTAWAARGLVALARDEPEFDACARQAAGRLRAWIGDDGRLLTPWTDGQQMSAGAPPDLVALAAAGAQWAQADWSEAASRVMERWVAAHLPGDDADLEDLGPLVAEAGPLARAADLYGTAGQTKAASVLLERAEAAQRYSGAVHEHLGHGPVLCRTVARLAAAWFRVGRRARGERAMTFLERHQSREGALPRRAGALARLFSRRLDPWAAKFYLDAAGLRGASETA
jgi:hypothetical protein